MKVPSPQHSPFSVAFSSLLYAAVKSHVMNVCVCTMIIPPRATQAPSILDLPLSGWHPSTTETQLQSHTSIMFASSETAWMFLKLPRRVIRPNRDSN